MVMDLPESDGFNAIFVVICQLTKHAHFYPITKEFSAKDLENLLYEHIWPLHGLPRQIISDRARSWQQNSSKNGVNSWESNQP